MTLREKCSNTEFFLVCIFSCSDWIRRDTEYLDTLHAVWSIFYSFNTYVFVIKINRSEDRIGILEISVRLFNSQYILIRPSYFKTCVKSRANFLSFDMTSLLVILIFSSFDTFWVKWAKMVFQNVLLSLIILLIESAKTWLFSVFEKFFAKVPLSDVVFFSCSFIFQEKMEQPWPFHNFFLFCHKRSLNGTGTFLF